MRPARCCRFVRSGCPGCRARAGRSGRSPGWDGLGFVSVYASGLCVLLGSLGFEVFLRWLGSAFFARWSGLAVGAGVVGIGKWSRLRVKRVLFPLVLRTHLLCK